MRFRRACRRKRLEEERGVAITKGFLAQGKAVGTGDAPAAMFLLILLRLLLGLLGRSAPDVAVPDLENPPEAYRKEVVVGEIHVLTSFLSVPRIGRNQKQADRLCGPDGRNFQIFVDRISRALYNALAARGGGRRMGEVLMIRYFRGKLGGESLRDRVIFAFLAFLLLFFGMMFVSHFLLPEGVLKNKNPLQQWEESRNAVMLTLQIFSYNMLSVVFILLGSLFGGKKEAEEHYFSVGYVAFFTQIALNGVVLGTWSFSMGGPAVPLLDRVLRTFDLAHRAGLWEMMGQMLIACAAARITLIRTSGKVTINRSLRDVRLTRAEGLTLVLGLLLMLAGAFVESRAILSL